MQISCVEVRQEVADFMDGILDTTLRRRMEQHFCVCEECAAVLEGVRNVVALVGDGRMFDPPAGFGDRLRQVLARKLGAPEHGRRRPDASDATFFTKPRK